MQNKKYKRLEYNDKNIINLEPRIGRSKDIAYNSSYPNLVVVIRKNSRKFYSSLTINGKTIMLLVGDCDLLSTDEAYEIVIQRKRDLLIYGDPQHTQKQQEADRKKEIKLKKFLADDFFPHLRLSNRSHKVAESEIVNHIMKGLGERRLSELESSDLERIMINMQDEGYKPSSINNIRDKARQIGFFAIKLGYLSVNPFKDVKKLSAPKAQLSHLADASIPARLIEAAKLDKNPVIAYFISIAALTGLRKSSILNLEWDMIDYKRKILTLEKAKSGKTNHTPLSEAVIEVFKSIPKVENNSCLFVNPRTGAKYTTIDNAFRRVVKKAGLEYMNITPHSLRHIYSSLYVTNGGSIYILQRLLNHSSYADVTARYAHLRDDTLQEANNKISNIIMSAISDKVG